MRGIITQTETEMLFMFPEKLADAIHPKSSLSYLLYFWRWVSADKRRVVVFPPEILSFDVYRL